MSPQWLSKFFFWVIWLENASPLFTLYPSHQICNKMINVPLLANTWHMLAHLYDIWVLAFLCTCTKVHMKNSTCHLQKSTSARVKWDSWIFTPAFKVTCIDDIFWPRFDMLCKPLEDCLTVKLAIFLVISRTDDKWTIITDCKWMKKIVDFACFPIYGIIQTV